LPPPSRCLHNWPMTPRAEPQRAPPPESQAHCSTLRGCRSQRCTRRSRTEPARASRCSCGRTSPAVSQPNGRRDERSESADDLAQSVERTALLTGNRSLLNGVQLVRGAALGAQDPSAGCPTRSGASCNSTAETVGPGLQTGATLQSSAAGSNPEHRRFGQANPGPTTTLRRERGCRQRLNAARHSDPQRTP
jgi:hypothetical protein